MLIYMVRHGETNLNAQRTMQGWLDEPLNQAGRDLAALLDRFLSGEGVRARLIADDKIYYPKEFIVDRYKT